MSLESTELQGARGVFDFMSLFAFLGILGNSRDFYFMNAHLDVDLFINSKSYYYYYYPQIMLLFYKLYLHL